MHLGPCFLREQEVLSLCSQQYIEGWLEGMNGHSHHCLFPASYVHVIHVLESGPRPSESSGPLCPHAAGWFQPLPAVPPAAFQPLLQRQVSPGSFQPPGTGFPYGGGAPQRSPQQLYGAYQACLGSDDDWNDEQEDSSTVADKPGALGSVAYQDLNSRRWRAGPLPPIHRLAPVAGLPRRLGIPAATLHQASGAKSSGHGETQPH